MDELEEALINGQISLQRLMDKRYQLSEAEHSQGLAWHLQAPPTDTTDALNTLAAALRDAGLCGPWRDEQLAVTNPAGEVIGTVERGAVRVLGVATRAVHLVGLTPDGRMWVQKRSLTKPNNPGLWDTLMGGMVSAADSLPQALARETWEEAGLRVEALADVAHGGQVGEVLHAQGGQHPELVLDGEDVPEHELEADGHQPHQAVHQVAGGDDGAAVGGVAVVLKVGV